MFCEAHNVRYHGEMKEEKERCCYALAVAAKSRF